MMPAPQHAPAPTRYVPTPPMGWQELEYNEHGFILPARLPWWRRVLVLMKWQAMKFRA